MVTLKQLKKENERLRKVKKELSEIERQNKKMRDLSRENKRLSKEIKFGKAIDFGKTASGILSKVGKRTGKSLLNTGSTALKGIKRYGDFLVEQERKQKQINRGLKKIKKTAKKKKTRRGKRR